LRDNDFRLVAKVCGREAKDGEAPIDELVLAAVISNQSFAMVPTVEFDNQAARWEVKVGPAHEATLTVLEIGLHLGTRQARMEEKPPQSGLHGRFGGFCEPRQLTQSLSPRLPHGCLCVAPESDAVHELAMHGHVQSH